MDKAVSFCLCGCGRAAKCRGLSMSCYARIREKVIKKLTTWEEQIKIGKCLEISDSTEHRKKYSKMLWGYKGKNVYCG